MTYEFSLADKKHLRTLLINRSQENESGCWEWQGAKNPDGYGSITYHRQSWSAHRLSYTVFKCGIPDGLFILHSCDNPPCINPDHLRVGTAKDNTWDAIERGQFRTHCGEANGLAKLTDADIAEIRTSKDLPQIIAERFGIDRTNVWQIQTGKTWKHLPLGQAPTRTPGRPAKLSIEDIDAIRASDLTGKELAEIFNVSQATVSMVRSGKHVLTKTNGGA